MASAWDAAAVAQLTGQSLPELPVIGAAPRIGSGLDLWDFWPVQFADGTVAPVAGGELWFALSAAADGEPVARHHHARLRLLRRDERGWRDLGNALPDGLSPGSREWSGSAVVDAHLTTVTLYFTAAGRRGEASTTFEQRLFETQGRLDPVGRIDGWTVPVESVASDGVDYVVADQTEGAVGTIKAFRDPGYFRDPADGAEYLLFAASLAHSASAFNGAVGVALRTRDGWQLAPPLIHAEGLNNELERPHVVVTDRFYYLFWSTQASVFAPGIVAPTGLYGMVADRLMGRWRPLNGSGLIAANPSSAPAQAYSWLVLTDLRVTSFIDQPGLGRAGFGGRPAPEFRLRLEGDRAWIA